LRDALCEDFAERVTLARLRILLEVSVEAARYRLAVVDHEGTHCAHAEVGNTGCRKTRAPNSRAIRGHHRDQLSATLRVAPCRFETMALIHQERKAAVLALIALAEALPEISDATRKQSPGARDCCKASTR
jgi:hypothetical protein